MLLGFWVLPAASACGRVPEVAPMHVVPYGQGFGVKFEIDIFFREEFCVEGPLNCLPVHGGFLSVEKSSFCSPSGDDAAAVYALKNVFPGR